jgi:hypothetical protein
MPVKLLEKQLLFKVRQVKRYEKVLPGEGDGNFKNSEF